MGLYDLTFFDLIQRNAQCFGKLPAWYETDDQRRLSFSEIHVRVTDLARGLQYMGLQKGDRIGVLGKNSLDFFLLLGAAAAVGAIVLPINWRLSAEEIKFNLNDGAPKLLFVDSEYQPLMDDIHAQLTGLPQRFNLKADGGGYRTFESLCSPAAEFQQAEVKVDDGFVIIHTAAVAGRPRGALLSHANLLCANMQFNYCLGLTPADVHLNFLPLFHVAGLCMAISSFQAGCLTINMSKFDAHQATELIQRHQVSCFFEFSPILSSILDEQKKSAADIGSLRAVMGLDTPETIERYQQLTGGTFFTMYGQTETSCLTSMGRYQDRPGAAGRVISAARMQLVDDYDRPVAAGQVGEIAVRGPMVFKGYWNLPQDNAYAFREGWHHTGDLGRLDEDGFLYYAGRKSEKELIKPGGENVYPAEVEKVIMQHPAVAQVVVFGVPDPKWKEGIKAVCRLRAGHQLTAKELISFVGQRIARYKKPQYVEFVEDMPFTAAGGIDREEVKIRHGGKHP